MGSGQLVENIDERDWWLLKSRLLGTAQPCDDLHDFDDHHHDKDDSCQ